MGQHSCLQCKVFYLSCVIVLYIYIYIYMYECILLVMFCIIVASTLFLRQWLSGQDDGQHGISRSQKHKANE